MAFRGMLTPERESGADEKAPVVSRSSGARKRTASCPFDMSNSKLLRL